MAFKDHLNFMGDNPCVAGAPGLERFVDLTRTYDLLTKALQSAAQKQKPNSTPAFIAP